MSEWRTADSLLVLRDQLNRTWPNRSKISDGFIGDAAHAAVASDHNPNAAGVVCAFDITHDPATLDAHALADRLLANRHPDLKYLISNRRIAGAWTYWRWVAYSGVDPHDTHIHVSVGVGDDGQSQPPYDDKNEWNITGGNDMIPDVAHLDSVFQQFFGRNSIKAEQDEWIGKKGYTELIDVLVRQPAYNNMVKQQTVGGIAVRDNWEQQIYDLSKKVNTSNSTVKTLTTGLYKVG